jgi:hypothetical protein
VEDQVLVAPQEEGSVALRLEPTPSEPSLQEQLLLDSVSALGQLRPPPLDLEVPLHLDQAQPLEQHLPPALDLVRLHQQPLPMHLVHQPLHLQEDFSDRLQPQLQLREVSLEELRPQRQLQEDSLGRHQLQPRPQEALELARRPPPLPRRLHPYHLEQHPLQALLEEHQQHLPVVYLEQLHPRRLH